jgi:hypothetical protein
VPTNVRTKIVPHGGVLNLLLAPGPNRGGATEAKIPDRSSLEERKPSKRDTVSPTSGRKRPRTDVNNNT